MKRIIPLFALALTITLSILSVNMVKAEVIASDRDATPQAGAAASPPVATVVSVQPSAIEDETIIYLGDPITVNGPGVVITGTTAIITATGTYRATGTLADGMIDINTDGSVELILDNATITNSTGPAVSVTDATAVSLVLADGTTNTLTDGETYNDTGLKATLFSNDTLIIAGSGDLIITGNYKHGIASDDDLIVESGNITITTTVKDGLHANDNITVNGGTIHIVEAGSDALESEGDLLVTGGELALAATGKGLKSTYAITITNGILDITMAEEGIASDESILISAGTIAITASDDALNAGNDITISGGQIYLEASGDAIDSNGTINIQGGVTVAVGGDSPEGGLDCGACEIAFDGGLLITTGGTHSTPSSSSLQHVVVLPANTADSFIHIMRDDGADTLTFKVAQTYESMIFTSPDLLGSRTYVAYTGGSISGGTEFHGLYTDATYTGGHVWAIFTTDNIVTYAGIFEAYLPVMMGGTGSNITPTVTPT
ncbi:MAG: carbohydrate-binding domain-containing protein, partial [Ardenticatenaceae bacterium]|nr:carbohydrate-binding domain-containing protein [Ardenticatenaceae bacterium]MCB8989241.1 carbohydrate-binding domain-containing protein [Ardenticatenaceae bacterium]